MGDFGDEFVNLTEQFRARYQSDFLAVGDVRGGGGNISGALAEVILAAQDLQVRRAGGLVLYFAPGLYNVGDDRDSSPRSVAIPSNVQLLFSPGAVLRPQRNVKLIVEGTVQAGPYPIFAYPRGVGLQRPPTVMETEETYFTRPRGNVIFQSTLQDYILPEWWGALPVSDGTQVSTVNPAAADVSDAMQAAIDAACNFRARGGIPLPPIPLRLSGIYVCYRTLVARRAAGQLRASLRVEGSFGVASSGGGTMSIIRVPTIAPIRNVPPLDSTALLRIEEGVDFHIQDVNLRAPPTIDDIVLVRCGSADRDGRRGRLLRCGLTGGERAMVRIHEPTVEARKRRHFTIDGCNFNPYGQGDQNARRVAVLTRRGLDVDAGMGVMVHVDSMLAGVTDIPYDQSQDVGLGESSQLHLRGGSVLIEASQFHNAVGPRPSREAEDRSGRPDLDRPDGQDFFIAATERSVPRTHFTAMECESQSWWLLGGSRAPGGPHSTVLLVAVAQANANWNSAAQAPGSETRRARWFLRGAGPQSRLQPVNAAFVQPPSLVWWGGAPLVVVGCRFEKYAVIDPDATVIDVATVFYNRDPPSMAGVWRNEVAAIRRPDYARRVGFSFDSDIPQLTLVDSFR